MDYPKIAQQVLDRVGGPADILSERLLTAPPGCVL